MYKAEKLNNQKLRFYARIIYEISYEIHMKYM